MSISDSPSSFAWFMVHVIFPLDWIGLDCGTDCGTFLDILTDCGTFLDILTSRTIYVMREICHADQE